jgi:sugar O-acyltransferase (sialic acid O-acetyltransferase NeuD family)
MSATSWCLVGSGGHARAVADVLTRLGERIGCISDREGQWRVPVDRVVREEHQALEWAAETGSPVVVGIGDNPARLALVEAAVDRGLAVPALVAATATVSRDAELGPGVMVMEHAHVGPWARVGAAVLVNTAAVVEHDGTVGAGTHLAPGSVLLGHASVGAGCLVGARATVLVGRSVGDSAVVGAGAVVTTGLAGHSTYVGVPAHPLPGRA